MRYNQAVKLHNDDEVIVKGIGSGIVKNVLVDSKNKMVLVDVSQAGAWMPSLHHTMIK